MKSKAMSNFHKKLAFCRHFLYIIKKIDIVLSSLDRFPTGTEVILHRKWLSTFNPLQSEMVSWIAVD